MYEIVLGYLFLNILNKEYGCKVPLIPQKRLCVKKYKNYTSLFLQKESILLVIDFKVVSMEHVQQVKLYIL